MLVRGRVLVGVIAPVAATALLALAAAASAAPGDLDLTYSHDGRVTIDLGQDEERPEIELDSQGRLVASVETGNTTCSRVVCSFDYDKALLRVRATGERDASFGSDGLIAIDGETNPDAGQLQLGFGLQSDGAMIVRSGFRWYAIRPNGTTEWSQPIEWCCPETLRVLSDDSVLIGGVAADGGGRFSFLLERRTPSGLRDSAFGSDGFVGIRSATTTPGLSICWSRTTAGSSPLAPISHRSPSRRSGRRLHGCSPTAHWIRPSAPGESASIHMSRSSVPPGPASRVTGR